MKEVDLLCHIQMPGLYNVILCDI